MESRIKLCYQNKVKIVHLPKNLADLKKAIGTTFTITQAELNNLHFYYFDSEKDQIEISTPEDLTIFFELLQEGSVQPKKIFIKTEKEMNEACLGGNFDYAYPPQHEMYMQTDLNSQNAEIQTERKNNPNLTNEEIIKKVIKKQFKKFREFIDDSLKLNNDQAKKLIKLPLKFLARKPMEKKVDPKVHYHVKCDGCGMYPIRGIRYKCSECKNFDYCEACEAKFAEIHGHAFIKLPFNHSINVLRESLKQKKYESTISITCVEPSIFYTKNNHLSYKGSATFKNTGSTVIEAPITLKCVDCDSRLGTEASTYRKPIQPGETFEVPLVFDLRKLSKTELFTTKWKFLNGQKDPITTDFTFKLKATYDNSIKLKPGFGESQIKTITTEQLLKRYRK